MTTDTANKTRLSAFKSTGQLLLSALQKFNPLILWHNPVLLITLGGCVLATLYAIFSPFLSSPLESGGTQLPASFNWAMAIAFWLTLYTATFAESLAEGRGRTETSRLRAIRTASTAQKVRKYDIKHDRAANRSEILTVDTSQLRPGDVIVLKPGDIIPIDGEVVWGIGMVDESAITGESAPVLRESGGERSSVIGGTKLTSDRIVVRATAAPGSTAVDRMIDLAEGRHRKKAPKELALSALLASFSFSFVMLALTLNFCVSAVARPVSIPILVALVVCLIPTEIAALMSVTGIASMRQLLQKNVLADSGHALETAADVTAVLLDKTGTITQGERRAIRFVPLYDADRADLIWAGVTASLGDTTIEGRSIVELARHLGIPVDDWDVTGETIPFSANTRISGRNLPNGTILRKGAESAVLAWLKHVGTQQTRQVVDELKQQTDAIAKNADTPMVVAIKPPNEPGRILGIIHLKDEVKPGIPRRMEQLHELGIKTLIVTGDNPLVAKTIAEEIGADDFLGDAQPQDKLVLVNREQDKGHFVAMSGDGANDAPAIAQADIGIAMNTATAAVQEAANMIILDNDPTRIIEIVEIGRRQMATRGALITFNIANDLVRYFTLFPALFMGMFPGLNALNLLHLHTAASAVLSTVIFSTVVMFILIPLAMVGVPYRLVNLGRALNRNLLIYGLGGIVVAAVFIKVIDLVVSLFAGY